MYISMHALQSIPPSCLNRDDTDRPKTCVYGQVERMRISSQCFKAAMRKYFSEHMDEGYIGIRTKYLPQQIADEILNQHPEMVPEEATELALFCIKKLGLKTKEVEEEGKTLTKLTTLTFVSRAQIRDLADIVSEHGMNVLEWDEKSAESKSLKKELVQAIQGNNSVDLALFGRMVADSKGMNVEGAANVAQVIGVSELIHQEDFYTAVDECNPRDDNGAGMMGDTRFVSDVAYRFASINFDELVANLSDQEDVLRMAVREAVLAFICAEPTARQHSMATHVMPEYVRIEIRTEPLSYVSAYEEPIENAISLMSEAAEKLEEKAHKFSKAYAAPCETFVLNLSNWNSNDTSAHVCENVTELADKVSADIVSSIAKTNVEQGNI